MGRSAAAINRLPSPLLLCGPRQTAAAAPETWAAPRAPLPHRAAQTMVASPDAASRGDPADDLGSGRPRLRTQGHRQPVSLFDLQPPVKCGAQDKMLGDNFMKINVIRD